MSLVAAALSRFAPVGAQAADAFAAITTRRSFAAGGWLLRAADRATHAHLVVNGLVRELYLGPEGQEHTRPIVAEGQVTGSLLDLLSVQHRAPHARPFGTSA